MKTIVKIMLFMAFLPFACSEVSAQQTHNPNLIPYSQFAPDSLAYLMANFYLHGSSDFYKNRPIKELLDDLVIPVKTVRVSINRSTEEINILSLYVLGGNDYRVSLFVKLLTGIKLEDRELYQKIIDKHPHGHRLVFDDEFRKLIEPLIIGEANFLWIVE